MITSEALNKPLAVKFMGLSEFDRDLLEKCLQRQAGSWEHFTDRFAGVMMAVVNHVATSRDIRTSVMDREDIVARIFAALVDNDFQIIRNFRRSSSFYTYLTVVTRRIAVRELIRLDRRNRKEQSAPASGIDVETPLDTEREDFEELLENLDKVSSELVRLRYVQDLPYSEIAKQMKIPENSIGPMLARARAKIRSVISGS